MADEPLDKQGMVMHLVAGAMIGAVVGYFLDNVFLLSSIGILASAIYIGRKVGNS
jgi:F0F1-type ATP synthase assembly protein I